MKIKHSKYLYKQKKWEIWKQRILIDDKLNNLKSIDKPISPILLTQNAYNKDNSFISYNKSNYNISGNNIISNMTINDLNENNF